MDLNGNWFVETVSPDLAVMLRLREVLYSGKTAYQKVEVIESDAFGRSLVLDGKTQSTEKDEFVYHESLVHPAMLCHPDPKAVFIGGGGEGGTLREVLAHNTVKSVTMVDLDQDVVELCRRHLPRHHQGSFDDPRTALLHRDARAFLAEPGTGFDVIILDLVDPLEGGAAPLLYTEEFYRVAKARLNAGGVVVTQSGPAGLTNHHECLTTIFNTLSSVFARTAVAHVHVPAFQTMWGFTLASDSPLLLPSGEAVDGAIEGRVTKDLKHYDGETHRGMFSLPKYLRQALQEETRINLDSAPVFMV